MIFQWKNKAIWLALTGSAVCLGFLGCSKPGGSGTSGNGGNTPADGGVVVTATADDPSPSMTLGDLGEIVTVTFKTQPGKTAGPLTIDMSKSNSVYWTLAKTSASFCDQVDDQGTCKIKFMVAPPPAEGNGGAGTFQIPATVAEGVQLDSKSLQIPYSFVSSAVAVDIKPINSFLGIAPPNDQTVSTPITVTIKFTGGVGDSNKPVIDSISDNKNWIIQPLSATTCSNNTCSLPIIFQPGVQTAATTLLVKYHLTGGDKSSKSFRRINYVVLAHDAGEAIAVPDFYSVTAYTTDKQKEINVYVISASTSFNISPVSNLPKGWSVQDTIPCNKNPDGKCYIIHLVLNPQDGIVSNKQFLVDFNYTIGGIGKTGHFTVKYSVTPPPPRAISIDLHAVPGQKMSYPISFQNVVIPRSGTQQSDTISAVTSGMFSFKQEVNVGDSYTITIADQNHSCNFNPSPSGVVESFYTPITITAMCQDK